MKRDFTNSFKGLRHTKHTHKALEDAVENAEAFLTVIERYSIKM